MEPVQMTKVFPAYFSLLMYLMVAKIQNVYTQIIDHHVLDFLQVLFPIQLNHHLDIQKLNRFILSN